MAYDWSQKVVLITGASSGIGRGLAAALGRRGAVLGLLARRLEVLTEVAQDVVAAGGRALALCADVRNARAVQDAAERLRREYGRIDVLIANAGVGATASATDLRPDELARIFEINMLGAAYSALAVIPGMVERGSGHLVAVSSLAAYRGLPKSGAYCASKAALSAFFESLRLDLHGTGLDVTIIHPGFIKTPLTAGRHARMPFLLELDEGVQQILRAIEARRAAFAFPWQLASVVRAGMLMPISLYDRVVRRSSFRE